MSEEEYAEIVEMLDNLKTQIILHKLSEDNTDPTELVERAIRLTSSIIDYHTRKIKE